MAELVDAHDSKSCEGNLLRVRFSPPAHEIKIPKSKRLGYFNFTVQRESKDGRSCAVRSKATKRNEESGSRKISARNLCVTDSLRITILIIVKQWLHPRHQQIKSVSSPQRLVIPVLSHQLQQIFFLWWLDIS